MDQGWYDDVAGKKRAKWQNSGPKEVDEEQKGGSVQSLIICWTF